MRHLTLFLLTTSLASAAFAQPAPVATTRTQTKSTAVEEIGYGGRNGGTKSTTTTTVSTTTAPAPAPMPTAAPTGPGMQPADAAAIIDDGKPVETIGFDAKVKRDPNGKVLGDTKTAPTTAAPEVKKLRTDQTIRSDASIARDKAAAAAKATADAQKATNATNAGSGNAAGAPGATPSSGGVNNTAPAPMPRY